MIELQEICNGYGAGDDIEWNLKRFGKDLRGKYIEKRLDTV